MAAQEMKLPPVPMTLAAWRQSRKPLKSVNEELESKTSPLDRIAIAIKDRVGTMAFFLTIFTWTVFCCGYNMLASLVPALGWKSFDPLPAIVAYLLISNVIQILLMPLLMVGQNLQSRQSKLRAEHDLETNIKTEEEIEMILMHLEHQQALLMELVKAQGIKRDAALED